MIDNTDIFVMTAPDSPIPDRINEAIKLVKPYQGHSEGTIVENIGRNAFGVPLYGVHLTGYEYNGKPITVDTAANEIDDEAGKEFQNIADRRLQMLEDWVNQ
jgi:hypothetical protein